MFEEQQHVRGIAIALTNIAFSTNDQSKPVFLLDNAHILARQELGQVSKANPSLKHTVLSFLITLIAPYRPPCIVAGTK